MQWHLGVVLVLAGTALGEGMESSAGPMEISLLAAGLEEPWAIGILPDGSFLVTERDGRLTLVRGEERLSVSGLPEVHVEGQAGL